MTTSTLKKRTAISTRIGHLVILFGLAIPALACVGGREGDRCIPVSAGFSHNDCYSGLTCTTIVDPVSGATCGESYCCPTDGLSGNPNCQPSLIGPLPDGAPGICPLPTTPPAVSSDAGEVDSGEEGGPAPADASGDATEDASGDATLDAAPVDATVDAAGD
jgi:hypothetical protein